MFISFFCKLSVDYKYKILWISSLTCCALENGQVWVFCYLSGWFWWCLQWQLQISLRLGGEINQLWLNTIVHKYKEVMFTQRTDFWKLNMLWIIIGDLEFWKPKACVSIRKFRINRKKTRRGKRHKNQAIPRSVEFSNLITIKLNTETRIKKTTKKHQDNNT